MNFANWSDLPIKKGTGKSGEDFPIPALTLADFSWQKWAPARYIGLVKSPPQQTRIAIIGGGPAGLMAAEAASRGGAAVQLFDAKASCGRKFLVAGKGGLNLTHSDSGQALLNRYDDRSQDLAGALAAFDSEAVRRWAARLGVETFIGSSGRVFPNDRKAAPLLRQWLRRLRAAGVEFHLRHRFLGWDAERRTRFSTAEGESAIRTDATVLALGGASWPRLGSDGQWTQTLSAAGVTVSKLEPANCGFECRWSAYMRAHHGGAPVKSVALQVTTIGGLELQQRGEFVISDYGVEGSLIYAMSRHLRRSLTRDGVACASLDLAPDRDLDGLTRELAKPRGKHSFAHHLKRRAGLAGVKLALLHESQAPEVFNDARRLAQAIKHVPLRLTAPRALSEAISTAGGVSFSSLDGNYMLRDKPGIFVAGEMLDWEAPTGGYLLTACLATGRAAGKAALHWATSTSGTGAE
ncbi:MAG: putative flavoprotein (TIGR03862 family) [Gammaproteobacteria bacterium]